MTRVKRTIITIISEENREVDKVTYQERGPYMRLKKAKKSRQWHVMMARSKRVQNNAVANQKDKTEGRLDWGDRAYEQ